MIRVRNDTIVRCRGAAGALAQRFTVTISSSPLLPLSLREGRRRDFSGSQHQPIGETVQSESPPPVGSFATPPIAVIEEKMLPQTSHGR
jgi:hypothetical protein